MKPKTNKPRTRNLSRPGDVYAIRLADGTYGYCLIIKKPDVVFLNLRSQSQLSIGEIVNPQILFRIFIMRSCFRSEKWTRIGSMEIPSEWHRGAKYYRRDAIRTDDYFIYDSEVNKEAPARKEECRGLEMWAVWSDIHVEPRLLDQLTGGSAEKHDVML